MIQGKFITGIRTGLMQNAIPVLGQQVRDFAVTTKAQFIYGGLALTAGTLVYIDVAEWPVLQMLRFFAALWINAGPETMQHALEQVGSEFKKGGLLFFLMGAGHQVNPVEHFLLLLQPAAALQLIGHHFYQIVQVEWLVR